MTNWPVLRTFLVMTIWSACLLAQADDDGLAPAKDIRAVWDLSMQPCNGGGGNLMRRNPQQESIRQSRVVALPQLHLQFTIPQLPDISDTHVKIYVGDRSRGVIDNYILLATHDLAPPLAAVVITELPATFDSADKAFAAVRRSSTSWQWALMRLRFSSACQGHTAKR